MHVLDVARDPNVGGGQGLVVLDVESDADLTGCPDRGVVAVGHGRHVQALHDAPPFGTPVRVRWRKRIWRYPEPLVTADCVIAPGGLRIRDTATGVTVVLVLSRLAVRMAGLGRRGRGLRRGPGSRGVPDRPS